MIYLYGWLTDVRRSEMKKAIIITILLMNLIPVLPCYAEGVQGIPSYIRTPEELVKWFQEEFSYRLNFPDTPKSMADILNSMGGDCEDFAFLASEFLNSSGLSNDILVVNFKGLNVAHAICMWKAENGEYSFISNKKLHHTGEKDLIAAVEKYYPDWENVVFSGKNRNFRTIVKRSRG